MTYTDRYNAIIHYFQRHPVDKKKIYCETHHIVPRSCGGSDKKENLVNLPAAWHYRVHCYLPFVMQEQSNELGYRKMLYAWQRCMNSTEEKISLLKINPDSREYALLKESLRKEISERIKNFYQNNPNIIFGANNPVFNYHWWKNPNSLESKMIKEGNPVPEGWVKGKWITENKKCGNGTRGKIEITDGKGAKFILPTDEIPSGWHRGIPERSKEARQKMAIAAKLAAEKRRIEQHGKIENVRKEVKEQYDFWLKHSWKEFVAHFNYKHTPQNFYQKCRSILKDEYHYKTNRV